MNYPLIFLILLLEILAAWEQWTGTSKAFYTSIGSSKTGIASIIGKAKRLKREGHSLPRAIAFSKCLGVSQKEFIRLALQDQINKTGIKAKVFIR